MAYSQTDSDNVKSAIVSLATGQQVVSVSIKGKSVQYAQADITKLQELLGEINADVAAAGGASRFYLTSTSKGL